jgi:hypothetical protein
VRLGGWKSEATRKEQGNSGRGAHRERKKDSDSKGNVGTPQKHYNESDVAFEKMFC